VDAIVIENSEQHRFEMSVGNALAVAYYQLDGDRVVLTHTEVPPEVAGQGVGSKLAEGTFELIRRSSRKAVTKCPFMARWASRHPSVADLVVG
jgi:uncharacterized protein